MVIKMIGELLKALLIPSLAGTCLAAVITLAKPITKKVFGYAWHYYIWLAVLIIMVLPVRFSLPQQADAMPVAQTQTAQTMQPEEAAVPHTEQIPVVQTEPKPEILQTGTSLVKMVMDRKLLAYVWLMGAVGLLLINLVGYSKLMLKMRRQSEIVCCPQLAGFTKRKVTVRVWEHTSSPFMAGLIKPTLVLPAGELTEEQLNNILRHEMTHLKRHDMAYKWVAQLVKCIHWFNPVIWYVAKQINTECEISCDMVVTVGMSREEEMRYIDTVLSLLPAGKTKQIPLTTQMTGNKKMLKRRFKMIRNKKRTSRWVSAVSAALAAVLLGTMVFASGVFAGLSTDAYMVELINNTETIALNNKPLIQNGVVYVPLRETLEHLGFNGDNSHIAWDNGKIFLSLVQSNGNAGLYGIEIGKNNIACKHIQPTEWDNAVFDDGQMQMSVEVMGQSTPILKGSVTYMPLKGMNYMLYGFLGVRNEDNSLREMTYNIYDNNGAIVYINAEMDFWLKLPTSWANQYQVLQIGSDSVDFVQTSTYRKYGEGSGTLFRIEKVHADNAEEILNMLGGSSLLYRDEGYAYLFEVPTDVQYPIWIDRDEEDITIAEQYEKMFKDIELIRNSFGKIGVQAGGRKEQTNNPLSVGKIMVDGNGVVVYNSENLKNPESVITSFFEAFADGNFTLMKNYCTQRCIDDFFGNDYVFGMKRASLQGISKDSDDLRQRGFIVGEWAALVNVAMTPDENSVYEPNQTEASFYMVLKQQNGRYLIDEFATGL